ncbi:MAG: SsrA-binding protein SmpB [Myxococcales bacterium]|nr:SsrA-binding protein SmpB [Myxococcota bacterium]MDW8281404.1 SsrA-binding protein SmpB [Myxococcales bacterium]
MAKDAPAKEQVRVLVRNKRARHDYVIEETIEAGLVLLGSEVKSLREGRAQITDAYAAPQGGELLLLQMQISEYPWANRWNHPPRRPRKLLLHRPEIDKLSAAVQRDRYTLLPLEVYLKGGRIKVLLGLGRGKKQHDRRQEEREKEAARQIQRALRH